MTARGCAASILIALGTFLSLAAPALAAGSTDSAGAEVLFREGKRLAAAGDLAAACPKFVESQRLDPSTGTLLNLGACYESVGQLASAWGAFVNAGLSARNIGDTGREAEAKRRADLLAPRLARLTVMVPPSAKVPGFEVKRDGDVVGEGQWGTAMPVDRGEHRIDVTAPGHAPWSSVVRVEPDGAAVSVAVPMLEKVTEQVGVSEPGGKVPPPFVWTARRIGGIGIGSAGVVGAAIGGVFGGLAASKYSATRVDCLKTQPNVCDAAGLAERATVGRLADVSTGLLVAGGALVVTGLSVMLTAPADASAKTTGVRRFEVTPVAGSRTTGLLLRGEW